MKALPPFKGAKGNLKMNPCGVSPNLGYLLGVPYNKDYNILGSILGSHFSGKLPFALFPSSGWQRRVQDHIISKIPNRNINPVGEYTLPFMNLSTRHVSIWKTQRHRDLLLVVGFALCCPAAVPQSFQNLPLEEKVARAQRQDGQVLCKEWAHLRSPALPTISGTYISPQLSILKDRMGSLGETPWIWPSLPTMEMLVLKPRVLSYAS